MSVDNKDYKNTLQLPQTEFPMRASLPTREPEQVATWLKDRTYDRMVENARARGKGKFLLHDGPPYANGEIHIGHVLNKVLKDIIVKYKNLQGFESHYVPGWDCHGLPIELGVEKQLLDEKRNKVDLGSTEIRDLCRKYAEKYIEIQKQGFQRLEVFGDWDHPYATMENKYVAQTLRELGKCADQGYLQRGTKAIQWCPQCATALAEAEVEYAEKSSPAITVKFDLTAEAIAAEPELARAVKEFKPARTSVLIWTTTPWTLPANLGLAMHPDFDYVALGVESSTGTREVWIVAQALAAQFKVPTLATFKAAQFERMQAKHPFIDRESLILLGDHVTQDAGTGIVHTAPGHGADDYRIGKRYGLPPLSPVDGRGKFTAEYAPLQGQFVFKANEAIITTLRERDALVAKTDITHSYPHCWRCHKPVIFRATAQWFIRVEGEGEGPQSLRARTLAQIPKVNWIPDWGIRRIQAMVESRPDWCISRQRLWGTPITVFYCEGCEHELAGADVFNHVAQRVEKEGANFWFTEPASRLVPPGSRCSKCGGTEFRKERDILDVWFDSGSSHAAVCDARDLGWPADLYLEGSDQHRGWFQSSLLTAVATRGKAPFSTVLTHGFINDKSGDKMSKSKGNVVSPKDLMQKQGAEILRLWVTFLDYRGDVNFSQESLERVSESYRKIRNTVRFLLGNLYDFDPSRHAVTDDRLSTLDAWALSRAAGVLKGIEEAYDRFEFHAIYHAVVNFCSVDLSAVYLDILKDRLYTARADSPERRSSQTALWRITHALVRALAPVLSFTAEEIWSFLTLNQRGKEGSVFEFPFPSGEHGLGQFQNLELEARFAPVWEMRTHALKALEEARAVKKIGHPREAKLVAAVPPATIQLIQDLGEDPARLCLVSQMELKGADTIEMSVQLADGTRCARCWVTSTTVGLSTAHPTICGPCEEAIR